MMNSKHIFNDNKFAIQPKTKASSLRLQESASQHGLAVTCNNKIRMNDFQSFQPDSS